MPTPSPYATTTRPEIHALIPPEARRVLDVGCNDGGFGAWLRATRPGREVWGVEPEPEQADAARKVLDGVVTGLYPEALDEIPGQFDCITFNHVLEHMFDPWQALARTGKRLAPGGCVIAVIPNVRHITLLADLVLKGRWEYQDSGLLDRTHVRFFTRSSIRPLFEDNGFRVDHLEPVNGFASVRAPKASRVLAAVLRDTAYSGFAVRARPA